MSFVLPKPAKPVVQLGIHLIVGATMAAMVLGAAFLLSLGVEWLERAHAQLWIIYAGYGLEFALFLADAYIFVVFTGTELIKFTQEQLGEIRQ